MLTIYDRHIMWRLVLSFMTLVGVLILFFIVLHYVEYVDDFFSKGASTRDVFLVYYPNYVPEIIRLTSPLALFLATIFLTAKLAQELFLIAMLSSSVSLYRLFVPFLLVGIGVTGGMMLFNGFVVPETNRVVIDFESRYFNDSGGELDTNNLHRQNRPGSIVVVGYFDQKLNRAHRVSLQQYDQEQRLIQRTDAAEMQWVDSMNVWRLNRPVTRVFSADSTERRTEASKLDTVLNLFPRDLARTERDVEALTIPQAAEYLESLERSGVSDLGRPRVHYHSKFAYPFANLILIMVAFPFASTRSRRGKAVQVGIALLLAFFYLALMKVTEPFGFSGEMNPVLTAWLPHVLFFGFGLVLLLRARK